jgi:hypothetical protein
MRTHKAYGLMALMALFPLFLGFLFSPEVYSDSRPATSDRLAQHTKETGPVEFPYNDYALFIAGMHNEQSSLAACEGRPAWVQQAKFFDQSWQKYRGHQLAPMRKWATEAIEAVASSHHTVFYPFSGADFISIYTLFPRAGTYVMMALEPVGKIPGFSAMSSKDFDSFFADFQHSLHDLLSFHYFVSAHMKADLAQRELSGVLPLVLFFMAREKAQVLDVQYWFMKADSTIREIPAMAPSSDNSTDIPGFKVLFKSSGAREIQTLYYFRFNVYTFGRNKHFVSFLRNLGPFTSFMKSASYVMFDPGVSNARQFVLDQSPNILQEDSGIPLRYFDPAVWDLRFFGAYTGAPSFFKHRYQDDLAKIYQAGKGIRTLPFGIGYHFRLNTSNLMWTTRKDNSPSPGLK